MTDRPVPLKNPIQRYAWGSTTEIQELLGVESDSGTPWAELWMGAHPKSPSRIFVNDTWVNLDEWIRDQPEAVLGGETARAYDNTLPYLFKVLAADQPLSIQAHPDRKQAQQGFERESMTGIPVDAPNRNYRDPWPKPELICAIKPFGALVGFRRPEAIAREIRNFCPHTLARETEILLGQPEARSIKDFFHAVMTLSADRRKQVIAEALENAAASGKPEAGWIIRLHEFYPADIGVLSPVFLNLVELAPGQALFLPAGVLHAYLYGLGIEIMANSDNVLRGGLTRKHVDINELMNVLRFASFSVQPLLPEPVSAHESRYPAPAAEFVLSALTLTGRETYYAPEKHSAEILLCLEGGADIRTINGGYSLCVRRGESVLVPAAAGAWQISGSARIFRAGVPL